MNLTRGTYVEQTWKADPSGFGPRAARRAMTYHAFVPAPISDVELSLSGPTAADVADAERALVRLRMEEQTTLGLESLTRSLLRSEAVASSWIEALKISHRKLAEAEQQAPGHRYDEARRVLGNVRAMAAAIEIGAASLPFTVDDILSMHGMLMSTSSLKEDRDRAGTFRDEPIFVGGTTPPNAEYVGPPCDEIGELIADLVTFVNERGDLSPTVVAALAHAQFESIHPFHDGNGRVGRCLIHTILRRDADTDVLPPVSVALAHAGSRYVDGLTAFRRDDLDAWISLFAAAVTFAGEATVGLGRRVAALRTKWEATLADHRSSTGRRRPRSNSAVMATLRCLADMPAFHTRDLAERLQVTWRAAQDAVLELERVGIVKQVSAGKGNRLYEVMEVFELLDGFETDPATFRSAAADHPDRRQAT
jgi:Fic family protein